MASNVNIVDKIYEQYGWTCTTKSDYKRKQFLKQLAKREGADIKLFEVLFFQDFMFQAKGKKQNLLNFRRNHPFYADWFDWRTTVHKYYSEPLAQAVRAVIFYSHDNFKDDFVLKILGTEEYGNILYLFGERATDYHSCFGQAEREGWTVKAMTEAFVKICDSDLEYAMRAESQYETKDDIMRASLLGRVISFLAHFKPDIWKRNMLDPEKQYYIDLIRTILCIPLDSRRMFNPEIIIDWQKYYKRKQPLLFTLYQKSHLDNVNTEIITQGVERLKHFLVEEQGGCANQCPSASTEEFWTLCEKIVSIPQEQGFLFDHQVSVPEEDWARLRQLLEMQRHEFISGFGDMLSRTAIKTTSLFLTATAIGCLVRYGCEASCVILIKVLNLIYRMITGDTSGRYDVVEQGGGITLPFLPAFFVQNVIQPPTQTLKRLWQSSSFDVAMRRIGFLGDLKIERGIERITTWIKDCFNTVYSWYLYNVHGIITPQDLDSDSHAIKAWYLEIDEFLKAYYENRMFWNETTWSVVYNLYSRGLTLVRTPAYQRYHTQVWKSIHQLSNILEQFKHHNKDGNTIRNPPVTIYLTGGTGVGKSSVTYPLAAEILAEIFKEEPCPTNLAERWKSLIYMRSSEQEFWDGYENQLITVFDDFSQRADGVANPNLELFEIIRASNCFPYPLHMAALEQKATTQFTSKVIIVSSNQTKPETASLNYPEALYRRFDVCVRVKRNTKEKMSRFNPEKFSFTLYDMVTGKDLQPITYDELVKLCTQEYKNRREYVDSIDEYITNRLKVNEQGWFDNLIDQAVPYEYAAQYTKDDEEKTNVVSFKSTVYERPSIDLLAECVKEAKCSLAQFDITWQNFKAEHPYLVAASQALCYLGLAIGFLKLFRMMWDGLKGFSKGPDVKNKELSKMPFEKVALPESYGVVQPQLARAEAYTTQPQMARQEAYNPTAPVVRAEGFCSNLGSAESWMTTEQGVKDLNTSEIINSGIRRNLYKIYNFKTGDAFGHVLFIRGKICILPKHFQRGLNQALRNDPDCVLSFKSCLLQRAFDIKLREFLNCCVNYESPEELDGPVFTRDLMVCAVPSAMIHVDISNHFVPRAALVAVHKAEVALPVLVKGSKGELDQHLLIRYRNAIGALSRQDVLPVGNSTKAVARYVRDVWRYEADTEVTECGAPVLVRNILIQPGKICGIHIAGSTGTGEGYATPFYREDVDKILRMFPVEQRLIQEQALSLDPVFYPNRVPEESIMVRLGKLKRPVVQPVRTKVRPSAVHGRIRKPLTKPCLLRPMQIDGENFDPREYRLKRLGNVPNALSRDIVNNARDALIMELSDVIDSQKDSAIDENLKPEYSFAETVKGIAGDEFINAVKRNTSPGFPWIQKEGCQDRHAFFGREEDYRLDSVQCQELEKRVEEIIAKAKEGICMEHLFVDTLKDERKPIAKAHKTRLFSAGPLCYLIACKKYFNGVVALLQRTRDESHISVGTNPYSDDWNRIAKHLLRHSGHMVAGDFEGFDASQHQLLLEAAGEVLIAISKRFLKTNEEQALIMRVLLTSLFNSIHIVHDDVVQWTHSLPSGHYLTAIINSIFVNLAFCCVWQIAMDTVTLIWARQFWKECGIVAYGDDHIVSIPLSRLEKFNQVLMPGLFSKIGLSYTMEDKDTQASQPSRKITEISYLKRGFAFDKERMKWIAPLSIDTILETPMWVHQCPDVDFQTRENLEWAIKELSLHPKELWADWHPILVQLQEGLGMYTALVRQDEVRDIVLE